MRRRSQPQRLGVVAVVVGLLMALVACSTADKDLAAARKAAGSYLQAWSAGKLEAAGKVTTDTGTAQAVMEQARTAFGVDGPAAKLGKVTLDENDENKATVNYTVTWSPPGTPPWSYDASLQMEKKSEKWQVIWSLASVHPKLQQGQQFAFERLVPPRAGLLDAAGQPIFIETPVVEIGIQPSKVTDLGVLSQTLAAALQVDAAQIVDDVTKALASAPDSFVPVITLRRPQYDAVRAQIYDLAGTVFRESTQVLPPTPTFARAVVGRVGTATEEALENAGDLAIATDQIGLSGLQLTYQKELAGTPGYTVSLTSDGGATVPLADVKPKPGTPVKTTIDTTVQNAADAAVAGQTQPAYLVAIRPSTGAVLAVSSNSAGTPAHALSGTYPPGSTFKIVSAAAALGAGVVTPTSEVSCPGTLTVDGKEFHNEDSFDLGTIDMTSAFAHSCNTTMIQLADQIPDEALTSTAAQFGIGADWETPVDTASGEVPAPASATEMAADLIGQGKVLVSPFSMALVAATVANGSTPAPMMVDGTPAEAKTPPTPPSADVLAALRPMMRAVVTDGTAHDLAGLPGEIAGKTGTAEFGSEVPPQSHAWFVGYRGDLAFAVLVEAGQSSKTTAVPAAGAFLSALPV